MRRLESAQHDRSIEIPSTCWSTPTQTRNLTRRLLTAAAEVQHIGDALTLLPFLPMGNIALADVGTGGGVPGIPLAIVRWPDISVITLIESTKKKAAFLQRAAAELGLSNLSRQRRAGGRRRQLVRSLRETFDVAVARAVATLDWLAEWCLPLVKVKGKVLAMKVPAGRKKVPEPRRAGDSPCRRRKADCASGRTAC